MCPCLVTVVVNALRGLSQAIALVATYMEIQVGNHHPTAALYIGTHKLATTYAGTLGIANG